MNLFKSLLQLIICCFLFFTVANAFAETTEIDLWDEIAEDFSLPHYVRNPEVQKQIHWMQTHKKFLSRVFQQSNPYLFYITQQVEKNKLPGELVLLPIIESAYDPFAHSWVGAAGLWQFMPQTAKEVNLKRNWWYDGRRDVINSTNAAMQYLSYLNKFFHGNWLYAIAAYNSGAGTVQRAIAHNKKLGKKTDFFSLPLPQETKNYVPRLLALAAIIDDPKAYNVKLSPKSAEPYFVAVDVGFQLDLEDAANMAGLSLDELFKLNAGYNRWTTAPGGPHRLLLPIEKVSQFEDNLLHDSGKHSKLTRYIVKENDNLEKLSKKFHTSVKSLKLVNKLANSTIAPKQTLLIPKNTHYHSWEKSQKLYHLLHPGVGKQKAIYVVKSGDSLWKIAHENHIDLATLRKWNKLPDNPRLRPGNKLVLWETTKVPVATYKVKYGDNLSKIALQNHVKLADLYSNNPGLKDQIKVGQLIQIPYRHSRDLAEQNIMQAKNTITKALNADLTYTVKPGDSLSKIAYNNKVKSSVLKQANKLNSDVVKVGQKLIIPHTKIHFADNQYTVQTGDSIGKIAELNNVTTQDLIKWNNLENDRYIFPGQKIWIKAQTG